MPASKQLVCSNMLNATMETFVIVSQQGSLTLILCFSFCLALQRWENARRGQGDGILGNLHITFWGTTVKYCWRWFALLFAVQQTACGPLVGDGLENPIFPNHFPCWLESNNIGKWGVSLDYTMVLSFTSDLFPQWLNKTCRIHFLSPVKVNYDLFAFRTSIFLMEIQL